MIAAALVTIASINFDRSVDFYSQFLGIQPVRYMPNVYAEFAIAGLRLGIFYPKSNHVDEFASPDRSGMSLCVEVEDLELAIDKISLLGYPPTGHITIASHGREIYAYDPDGNRLILHQSVWESGY